MDGLYSLLDQGCELSFSFIAFKLVDIRGHLWLLTVFDGHNTAGILFEEVRVF